MKKECPECKKNVDYNLKRCSNCGFKLPREKKSLKDYDYSKLLNKKIGFAFVGIVLVVFIFNVINNDKKEIENTVNEYFSLIKEDKNELANKLLTNELYLIDNAMFNEENTKLYLSKLDVKVTNVKIEGARAIVELERKAPDLSYLFDRFKEEVDKVSLNNMPTADEVYNVELKSKNLEYTTKTFDISLVKNKNNWEIENNEYLTNSIFTNISTSINFDDVIDDSEQESKEEKYLQYVQLVNYNLDYFDSYSSNNVPGISDIEIKNNGDHEITEIKLKLEFKDDNGKVISEKIISVMDLFTPEIKPNYSFKQEEDKFFEVENLSSEISLENVSVTVHSVKIVEYLGEKESEEEIYIREYMDLLDYNVKIHTKYNNDRIPGISEIEIKNRGEKNLNEVTITVYFQDENYNDIAENSILVIGNIYDYNDGLKSNYSWKMDNDKFYELENLSEEVSLSRYRVEISEIEFE